MSWETTLKLATAIAFLAAHTSAPATSRLAWDCIKEARQRIAPGSKDFLDLRILEGDVWSAKREDEKCLGSLRGGDRSNVPRDYQISEIVARAHYHRAKTLMRMGRTQDAADGVRRGSEYLGALRRAGVCRGSGMGRSTGIRHVGTTG